MMSFQAIDLVYEFILKAVILKGNIGYNLKEGFN